MVVDSHVHLYSQTKNYLLSEFFKYQMLSSKLYFTLFTKREHLALTLDSKNLYIFVQRFARGSNKTWICQNVLSLVKREFRNPVFLNPLILSYLITIFYSFCRPFLRPLRKRIVNKTIFSPIISVLTFLGKTKWNTYK